MAELKTKPNAGDVTQFLSAVEPESRRDDSFRILNIMKEISGEEPVMWGPSIHGFGNSDLKYDSGRELKWFLVGFSPGKQNLTLYLMNGLERHSKLLSKPGKYKTGKSCLYINKLTDIDLETLNLLISDSLNMNKNRKTES